MKTQYYSREIKMPATKLEGLQNFVQMIINAIERDDARAALLTAVDLLDDLSSKSNPYSEITDGKGNMQIVKLQEQHSNELADAIKKAHADGVEAGVSQERARIANMLGVAA